MKAKLHPKGLRLICLDSELDGDIVKQIHVVRVNLADGTVSSTACGIRDQKAFAFPFHHWIWLSVTAPICEDCYQVVQPRLRKDLGF